MADPRALEQDAMSLAQRAVTCDQNGLTDTATFYYMEAAQALLSSIAAGSTRPGILEKAQEYINRAEILKNTEKTAFATPSKSLHQLDAERARFLIEQAFEEDEHSNIDEAVELYTQAVELCLSLRKESDDKDLQEKATKLATNALNRAEVLKQQRTGQPPKSPRTTRSVATGNTGTRSLIPGPLGFSLRDDEPKPGRSPTHHPSGGGGGGGGGGGYTKEELNVLKITSNINGRSYVPFMSVDMKERFAFPVPFADKCGMLALSPKQRSKFGKWARPEDYMNEPTMIFAISCFSIKQTIVSDCSFVASLAISAQYERRFRKKLITSIIYPQNRQGEPQYNPCGKYMVKLNINGVPRKVIVDDYLPMDKYGQLLCSYSNNHNELWISLLEKAYMKVMGGYDFPGSNSNIDLHALTGWIPERIGIRLGSEEFNPDHEFDRIHDRFHKGHCLVTVATGEMPEADADRAGLVPTHAYAMIDIRKVKNKKLLQLKNPWSHLRWKGNYSEKDTIHWTPEMQKALNYDPKSASQYDNGVFWIDYESLLKFYDVFYLNWNPDLFPHTTCMHHTWTAKEGPKKDAYNIGDNPQYRLQVKGPGAVWILLTRHIVDKDDFANNREFITILVYRSEGKRVFYPHDPPPYKDGVRINSPHYLCKMVEESGTHTYTLVISQYEKSNTIHYTLRVYATHDFSLTKIAEPYVAKYERKVTGQWKGRTAGGCSNNHDTFKNNPIYQVKIDNSSATNNIMIELRGPREFSVGFDVVMVVENVTNLPTSFKKKSSGAYRPGFCVLELENVVGGVYNIIPCTFYPGKEGPFFLNVSSSVPITLSQLQ